MIRTPVASKRSLPPGIHVTWSSPVIHQPQTVLEPDMQDGKLSPLGGVTRV